MKINNETKIGLLVVVVAIILGVITWKAGDYDFSPKGYELKVQFQNIDGVEENAPVTLNGLEVGRVSDIEILYGDATRVELRLWMKSDAKLHEGAKAYVKNMGFLGREVCCVNNRGGWNAVFTSGINYPRARSGKL